MFNVSGFVLLSVSVMEVLPEEKKADVKKTEAKKAEQKKAEEKTAVLGQAVVDLLPLLQGTPVTARNHVLLYCN